MKITSGKRDYTQVNVTYAGVAEAWLNISKSEPFSIKKYPFFYQVYDSGSNSLMLKCSRQVGKSLTIANHGLVSIILSEFDIEWVTAQGYTKEQMYELCIRGRKILYVAPTGKQAGFFSKQKLQLILEGSPVFEKFRSPSTSDQVMYKSFTGGSDFALASCFHSANGVRGFTSDSVYIDEIQDIYADHIPVILETQNRSSHKRKIFSGTPKTTRHAIAGLWKDTTQCEWVVKCEACNKWQVLKEDNIGKFGIICDKGSCRKPLNYANGQWARMNKDAYMEGFRIHSLMSDFTKWTGPIGSEDYEDSIMHKYAKYDKAKFYNEVLGLDYDSGVMPISEADLRRCCLESERKLFKLPPGMIEGLPVHFKSRLRTAGIDWGTSGAGKSRTVISIYSWYSNKYVLLYSKIYGPAEADPLFQMEDILNTLRVYQVNLVGVDWGFGHMKNETLAEKFGGNNMGRGNSDRVLKFVNNANIKLRRRWNDDALNYTLNRTEVMSDFFRCIKAQKYSFPVWNTFKHYADDVLCIYKDFNESTNSMMYNHSITEPDDFTWSTIYAIEAMLLEMDKDSAF